MHRKPYREVYRQGTEAYISLKLHLNDTRRNSELQGNSISTQQWCYTDLSREILSKLALQYITRVASFIPLEWYALLCKSYYWGNHLTISFNINKSSVEVCKPKESSNIIQISWQFPFSYCLDFSFVHLNFLILYNHAQVSHFSFMKLIFLRFEVEASLRQDLQYLLDMDLVPRAPIVDRFRRCAKFYCKRTDSYGGATIQNTIFTICDNRYNGGW